MNWIKNKLLAALVSKIGPIVSGSISASVGGIVGGSVALVQAKVSPYWWEWITFVFHLLPDDIEKYLTPEIIGGGAGFAFYAVLQEWLNRRQAKGITEIQEAQNSVLPEAEKVKVDGVASDKGETVQKARKVAHKALPAFRQTRG